MMKAPNLDLAESLRSKWEKHLEELGRFNLVLLGKTGVGKSTLINAVFGEQVAATGVGRPVTQARKLFLHHDGLLGLIDTKGLEVGQDDAEILKELREFMEQSSMQPLHDRPHAVWYCISANGGRVEPAEIALIRGLADLNLPVFVVLTQVGRRGGVYDPRAVELAHAIEAEALPLAGRRVHLVMAQADTFAGLQDHGLHALIHHTIAAVPDAVKAAVERAQRVDWDLKVTRAKEAVAMATAAAATAGAVPIPFADAAVLVPIQTGMMVRIAILFGVPLDGAMAATFALTAGTTNIGRSLVSGLIKLIPGVGTVIGGAISASIAAALTTGLGSCWLSVCTMHARGEIDLTSLPADEIVRLLRDGATSPKAA